MGFRRASTATAAAVLDPTGKILTGSGVKPSTIVTVYVNGTSVGTTTANSSGAWTYTFSSAPASGAVVTYAAVTASGTTVILPLGPATASFTSGAASGSAIATITGLSSGETATSISPNDGRVAIAGSGTTLVAGLTASSAGTTNYTVTTSAGRTLAIAVTASATAVRSVLINQTVQIGSFIGTAQRTQDNTKTYPIQVAGSEPVTAGSGSEVRFEVRGTDNDEVFDPQDGTKNRAELTLGTTVPFYVTLTADFDFKLDSNGTVTDRSWLIPFQIHGDDALGTSPVFALDIQPNAAKTGEIIRVAANNGPSKTAPSFRQFNDPSNVAAFTRDVWHTAHIEFVPDKNEGKGRIKVVFDGVTLINLASIPTGFADAVAQGYAKTGIYAGTATQLADTGLVSHVRNAAYTVTAAAAATFDSASTTFDSSTLTFDKAA